MLGTFSILVSLAFLTGGCDKSPTFHEQVYMSLNGGTVLTLVSKDECELAQLGTTLLCKYTKQNDKLRVVTTALGTSQVIYFLFTDQGLQDNNGNVLLSPEKYAAAIEEIQRQRQAQEACVKNLRTLDGATQQWALDNKKKESDTPEWNDIYPYLPRNFKCPQGGTYSLDAVRSYPKCSIPGHELPPDPLRAP